MDVAREAGSYAKFITDWTESAPILDFWRSCHPGRDADPALFEFLLTHHDGIIRPHIIAAYRGGQLEAVLVGRLESTRLAIKLGYVAVGRPTVRLLTFVYGGWLGNISEEIARLLVSSIVQSLAAGEADAAMFHYPEVGSPLVRWGEGTSVSFVQRLFSQS